MRIFPVTLVCLFLVLLQNKVKSQTVVDYCVKSGLASNRHQSLIQRFLLRLDVVNIKSKYEKSISNDLSDQQSQFMDEGYLEGIGNFMFNRNEILVDHFWDSMMEALPPTWHVYGTRPAEASIIGTRFMESCASNIYSLFKDGKIEKFHSIASNMRDTRYLTLGKVNEICKNIKERVESNGLELSFGIQTNGRSSLPAYYRCQEVHNDELADILMFILDKMITKFSLSKLRICKIVNSILREPGSFRDSCYGVLSYNIRRYIPFDRNSNEDLAFVCDTLDATRKFAGLFSKDPVQITKKNIKDIIVESLLRIYPCIELTSIGVEMVDLMKISEYRFIESCMNFSETLFALQGFKVIKKNSSKQEDENFTGLCKDENAEDCKFNQCLANPSEGDPNDFRKKLFFACSAIHMYMFELKPKGISFTKLRSSRVTNQEDFSMILKSKLLFLDSCNFEFVFILGKYTITQNTLSEIILTAILHSSSNSMSSNILYNGVVKEYICKISGEIINSLGKNFLTSPIFEETNFMTSCRQVLVDKSISRPNTSSLDPTLKKSIIKLCSIITKSLVLISDTQSSHSNLYDDASQDDDELTSSECLSEEI